MTLLSRGQWPWPGRLVEFGKHIATVGHCLSSFWDWRDLCVPALHFMAWAPWAASPLPGVMSGGPEFMAHPQPVGSDSWFNLPAGALGEFPSSFH